MSEMSASHEIPSGEANVARVIDPVMAGLFDLAAA